VTATLQVTWWKPERYSATVSGKETVRAATTTIALADPVFVQPINFPKDGSISPGAICGGTVSLKSVPSAAPDLINALIKSAGDSKAATQKK
jgi:hypothetical protein